LTRENYAHGEKLSKKLTDGYRKTVNKVGIQGYVVSAGANGVLMLYPKEVRNYRDWITIDTELWRHYWFAMVNRGVMPQPHWWDEQWTISVQHTEADIDKHLAAFEDVAPALARAQERTAGVALAGTWRMDPTNSSSLPLGAASVAIEVFQVHEVDRPREPGRRRQLRRFR
jgi:glutamate-1-semialdehyde 2,1-aminomutase